MHVHACIVLCMCNVITVVIGRDSLSGSKESVEFVDDS